MENMTLGRRIQEQRKRRNLSQEALGEAMGVSRQAISKWESDLTIPEIDKLIALSKRFDVPVGQLLGVEEPEEKKPVDEVPEAVPRDRRLIRWLSVLCAVLAATSMLSLGLMLHFRQQVMTVLDPPKAPEWPVTELEYALRPDFESKTFDLAVDLKAKELRGWDAELMVYTRFGKDGPLGNGFKTQRLELPLPDGTGQTLVEDMPFAFHEPVSVMVYYTDGQLEGAQDLMDLEPLGPGMAWRVTPPTDAPDIMPEENRDLFDKFDLY